MKKFLASLIFIFTLLSFFSTYAFFQSETSVKTFKQFSSPQYKLSKTLLKDYYSEDSSLKKKAEEKIITTVLKGMDYERWLEYLDYIELRILHGQILSNNESQAIISLNLSKDVAAVAIYNPAGDDLIYHSKIENLSPITNMELIKLPEQTHQALAITQVQDERFGAFFYEEFLDIFNYYSGGFKNVWHKTLYYEEIYKETWIDPKADEKLWHRIVEETQLQFVPDDPFTIKSETTQNKFTAKSDGMPSIESFSLIDTFQHKDYFYWSPQYQSFILGEVTEDVFISNAALLEDLSKGKEALYGIKNNNYKIITSRGELIYLPKNKFKGMFQFPKEE